MKSDINISGHGFYQITADSARGRRFLSRVQGASDGVAYCDDSRLTQDIADGAVAKGLRVIVNDSPYGR